MPRILSTYGSGFMPAAINLHPPLKGSSIAALFATAAIYLQQHCNTDGTARRNRLKGPLAALFWALVAVLDRRNSPFFLQCSTTTICTKTKSIQELKVLIHFILHHHLQSKKLLVSTIEHFNHYGCPQVFEKERMIPKVC